MSWHALFAKEHTEQLLWASIIRKCNKIRQTDYISELGSKIKTQFGEGFNYGDCACLFEHQPLNHSAVAKLGHKFASECVVLCTFLRSCKTAGKVYTSLYSCLLISVFVGGQLELLVVRRGQPVATYTGFQPAIDTSLVLANGCSNHFRLCCQLVSNRG